MSHEMFIWCFYVGNYKKTFLGLFMNNNSFFVAENRYSLEHRKYYFFDLRNCRFENMDARPAGNGEWRRYERNTYALSNNQLIARKNTYVYWRVQGSQALMTQWWMHEFVISTIFHPTRVMNIICIDHYHYQKLWGLFLKK